MRSPAAALPSTAALPAFPGAEGFGSIATGGRDGDVYCVTNRNASGAGSFGCAFVPHLDGGTIFVQASSVQGDEQGIQMFLHGIWDFEFASNQVETPFLNLSATQHQRQFNAAIQHSLEQKMLRQSRKQPSIRPTTTLQSQSDGVVSRGMMRLHPFR